MLQYNISIHRKSPQYEVKAIVTLPKLGGQKEEIVEDLVKMRGKLEQNIPGMWKAKYNITSEELIIAIRTERTSQAQSIRYKLEEMIKVAAKALGHL